MAGYSSDKPLNFGNSGGFSSFGGFGSSNFGGNGFNNFNSGGFGNSFSFQQNDVQIYLKNVAQWLQNSISEQLKLMVSSNFIPREAANLIMGEVETNLNKYMKVLQQKSQNFQYVENSDFQAQFIAGLMEYLVNTAKKIFENMKIQNNIRNQQSFSDFNNSYNSGGNNGFGGFNFNSGNNINTNNSTNGAYVPKRKRYNQNQNNLNDQQQSTVQSYANNTQVIDVPTSPVEQKYMQEVKQSLNNVDISDVQGNDTPLILNKDCSALPFDPDKMETWPVHLFYKCEAIRTSSEPDGLKPLQELLAVAEVWWQSKGIIWSFDNSIQITNMVRMKREERKMLPAVVPTIADIEGYTFKLPDQEHNDNFDTKAVKRLSISDTNHNVLGQVLFVRLIKENIVLDEDEFIEDLGDGRLAHTEIVPTTNSGNKIMKPLQEGDEDYAVSINYETTVAIDIPQNLMSVYHKSIQDILKKYSGKANGTFNKCYNEITAILNDIPRIWSEKLDKFITQHINESLNMNFRDPSLNSPRPPHVSSWMDIKYLLNPNKYNPITEKNYSGCLNMVLYSSMMDIFDGTVLNPNTSDQDLLLCIESAKSRELIDKYYQKDFDYDVYSTWNKEAEDYGNKITNLKECLSKFTVFSVSVSVMFTTLTMPTKYVRTDGSIMLTPMDEALGLFERLIYCNFDYNGLYKSIYLIASKDGKVMTVPDTDPVIYAKFKPFQTIDGLLGYSLITD